MCECYKIDGPFIDVDPDCPIPNKNHRDYQEDQSDVIEQLQAKIAELTSNVSKWASLAEANQQVAESAQRRADKLAAENARLKAESRDACLGLNDYYGRKLAAAQEECEFQRNAHKQAEELMLEQSKQLAAAQEEILIERSNGDHWRDAYSKWVNTLCLSHAL